MTADEKKKATAKKRSESLKRYWKSLSDEKRKKRGEKVSNGISKMSDEDKQKRSINSSIATKAYMKSLSKEEKYKRSLKLSEANKLRYANMSDEQRLEIGRKISEGQHNMSETDKKIANMKRSESMKKYIRNLSPEESDKRRQRVQTWWDNMHPEEYQEWKKQFAKGYNNYISNLNTEPNHNETEFINYLNTNGIIYHYQYYNTTKDPDFDKLFPSNPVTGSKLVSPFHKWDFLILTLDRPILVDIDGSIHFNESYSVTNPSTNVTYNMLEYHKFNDSQRAYQTDGMDAYVVECPDDNLTKNSKVVNISSGETITFDVFICILTWMNLTEKEKNEIVNKSK